MVVNRPLLGSGLAGLPDRLLGGILSSTLGGLLSGDLVGLGLSIPGDLLDDSIDVLLVRRGST